MSNDAKIVKTKRLVDTLIRLAVEQFGFELKDLVDITLKQLRECTSGTRKLGVLPCLLEKVTHEICHVLSEDQLTVFIKGNRLQAFDRIKYERM
jgi:hypothetical protein